MRKPWFAGLLQASGIFLTSLFIFYYIGSGLMRYVSNFELFTNSVGLLSALTFGTMLLIFGIIILAYPMYLASTGRSVEAIKMVVFTAVFMVMYIVLFVGLTLAFGKERELRMMPYDGNGISQQLRQEDAMRKAQDAKDAAEQARLEFELTQKTGEYPANQPAELIAEDELDLPTPGVYPYPIDIDL